MKTVRVMSRNLTKTPSFRMELFLEHPKNECLPQTTPFRARWHIVFLILSKEAKEVYDYLNVKAELSKKEKSLLKAVNYKIELIKNNFHYGEPIAKNLIPQEYIDKYGITNIFRVELPDYWRMLYSLNEGESSIEIIAFVLDILSHPDYDKKLGYRKR